MGEQEKAERYSAGAEVVQTCQELARLVQRELDCQAVVLCLFNLRVSVEQPDSIGRAAPPDRIFAAFREGGAPRNYPDLQALAHPVTATEQGMRFHASLPLRDPAGRQIGMLAAADCSERELSSAEYYALCHYARIGAAIATQQCGSATNRTCG